VALCKKVLDVLGWPTLLTIYGGPGSGKTNLALEFVKYYCISSCLYVSTQLAPTVERMSTLGINLRIILLRNVTDYVDLVDVLLRHNFHMFDLAVFDPINVFAREGGAGYSATLFALAALRRIHEVLGLPIILTAMVHRDPGAGEDRPLAENAIYFWSKGIARLEHVGGNLRRILIERPRSFEATFKISKGGIEWSTC